jgi:nucleoside-diphosphate-sugar epimerase
MLALVTGGQGFVGSHLCERLAAAGHRVRVFARATSDLSPLDGLGAEIVRGDLGGEGDLGQAVDGVDWVFHVAGALMGLREEDLVRVNREGTRRLCEACLARAPRLSRFVFISSLAAVGPSPGGAVPILEDAPARPVTWYGRSKLEAEEVVRSSGLPSVILRPPVVFGPRDREVFKYFNIARRGILPVPGRRDRSYSLVFAPDLAEGILKAAETEVPSGEILHLTGPEVVTWSELGRKIAAALGTRDRVLRLPESLVRAAGHAADLAARLQGRPHIFSSQKVIEMLAPAWVASPLRAREVLGWTARTPLDEALALTVRWYREHGWL